jgi:hypothetical protein
MNDTILTVNNVTVVYGLARTYMADPDQFRIFLKNFNGEDLFVFRTYDPLGIRVYVPSPVHSTRNDNDFHHAFPSGSKVLRENFTRLPEKTGEFIIPFAPGLKTLEFRDATGKYFGSVEVAGEINDFCRNATSMDPNNDVECSKYLISSYVSPTIHTMDERTEIRR